MGQNKFNKSKDFEKITKQEPYISKQFISKQFSDKKNSLLNFQFQKLNNKYVQGLDVEEFIVRLLRLAGFTIIARNVKLSFTELDIVCAKGKTLYVFEVKSRVYFKKFQDNVDIRSIFTRKKISKIMLGANIIFARFNKVYDVFNYKPVFVFVKLLSDNHNVYKKNYLKLSKIRFFDGYELL